MTTALGKLTKVVRLPVYRALQNRRKLLRRFSIKLVPFKSEIEMPKLAPLFPGLTGQQLRTGIELARAMPAETPVEGIEAVVKFAEQMLKDNLTAQDRQLGYNAVLGVADDLVDLGKLGHLYLHAQEMPLNDQVWKILTADSAFALDPFKLAEAVFTCFPGSANVTDDAQTLHRVRLDRNVDGELVYYPLPDPTSAVVPVPKPLPRMDFQLAYGNFVEISGATNIKHGNTVSCSWLNSTTWRHALDGRVLFILRLLPAEKLIRLFALGFGQHPSEFADAVNPHMGSAIFSTMLETFVAAVERHVQDGKLTTFDATVLDGLIAALQEAKVDSMTSTLFFKHLFFEALNMGAVLGAQWPRMLVGGNTVSAPSLTTSTTAPKVSK
jgi:hypothetical protein